MGVGGVDDAEEAMAPPQMVGWRAARDCMCMWAPRRHVARRAHGGLYDERWTQSQSTLHFSLHPGGLSYSWKSESCS